MITYNEWLITESKKNFTVKDVKDLAAKGKLDISKFSMKELVDGLNTEKEHMSQKKLDVIKGDKVKILKIALAHLDEDPHYYKKLKKAKL